MPELTLSMEAMQLIASAEDIILKQARKQILKEGGATGTGQLSIQIVDLVEEEDKLTFMVAKGQLGLALGKGARNLQALKNAFSKEAKIIEFDEDLERFVRNCFKPHQLESIAIEAEDISDLLDDDDDDEPAATGDAANGDGESAESAAAEDVTEGGKATDQLDGGASELPKSLIRVRVTINADDKGKAIGKGGRNINVIRTLARRHHDVVELKVE